MRRVRASSRASCQLKFQLGSRARVRPGAKLDASRFHPVTLMQGSAAFAVVANTLAARSTLQSRLLSASAISGRAKSSMLR